MPQFDVWWNRGALQEDEGRWIPPEHLGRAEADDLLSAARALMDPRVQAYWPVTAHSVFASEREALAANPRKIMLNPPNFQALAFDLAEKLGWSNGATQHDIAARDAMAFLRKSLEEAWVAAHTKELHLGRGVAPTTMAVAEHLGVLEVAAAVELLADALTKAALAGGVEVGA